MWYNPIKEREEAKPSKVAKMSKTPRFTEEQKKLLEAGHEVQKGKYIYRIHGKYFEDSWHWVLQRGEETDEDWEDYKML